MLALPFVTTVLSFIAISLTKQSKISLLVAIELLLLSITLVPTLFSHLYDFLEGQLAALFVLTFSAAESAIGLALLVLFYRAKGRIDFFFTSFLKT